MIAEQRRKRLVDAMQESGLDVLLVYGNAWQGDYLRYATDFGILEGPVINPPGDVCLRGILKNLQA